MAHWLPASTEAGADSPAPSHTGHGSLEATLADTTRALEAALAEAAAEAETSPDDAGVDPFGSFVEARGFGNLGDAADFGSAGGDLARTRDPLAGNDPAGTLGALTGNDPAGTLGALTGNDPAGAGGSAGDEVTRPVAEPWAQAAGLSPAGASGPAVPTALEPSAGAGQAPSVGTVKVVGAADAIAALTDMVPQPPASPRAPAPPAGGGPGASAAASTSAARLAAPGAQALLSHVSSGSLQPPATSPQAQSPAAPSDERAIDSGYLRIGVSGGLRAAVAPAGGDLTLPDAPGSVDPTWPGAGADSATGGRHGNPGARRAAPGSIQQHEAPKAASSMAAPPPPPQPAIRPWQPSDDDILPSRGGRRGGRSGLGGRSVKLSLPKINFKLR